jgi:hypothetical protein
MITENTTMRDFLQTLGTECLRDNLSKNIWAAALFADYKEDEGYTYTVELLGKTNENPDVILPGKGKETFKVKILGNPEKFNNGYPSWCITDMRFPNELEAVKDRGGITIRVNREIKTDFTDDRVIAMGMAIHSMAKQQKQGIYHPSETALDNAEFDYELINDGTLEDLIEKVREILIKEKII